MKHATRILWMTILVLLISSCQEEPTFRVIAFNDAETKATEITEKSAHLSCMLEELEQGGYYKYGAINMVITNYPDYFNGQTISGSSHVVMIERLSYSGRPEAKSYSVDVKSLTPSTTYYFAPIVGDDLSNSGVIGEMKSFTTKGIPSISVTTGSATNITNTSATVSGAYELINEAKLGEFGILLHTSSYLSYGNYTQRQIVNVSPFTYTFTGLTENKTYYYCAYAKDSKGGIFYGEIKSFTTLNKRQSLSDYLGTYTMTYLTNEKSGYQTRNDVIIGGPNSNGYIYMTNLPPYGLAAFGTWDEATHKLTFDDHTYSTYDIFESNGHDVVPIFTPFYYNKSTNKSYNTYLSDGYAYIDFIMTSSGIIEMKSPSTAGQSGYYSNAYCWMIYNTSSWENEGSSYAIYDVTLTKTSSSYNAPAKSSSIVPYKCEKITNSYKSWYLKFK